MFMWWERGMFNFVSLVQRGNLGKFKLLWYTRISWGWQSLDGLLTDIRHDDWYRKYWKSEENTSKHVLYAPAFA